MDKIPVTIRVTSGEKKMLQKRAAKYGMSVNGLVRFWRNSEPDSPRVFVKSGCNICNGTGKSADRNPCKKCRGMGYAYLER